MRTVSEQTDAETYALLFSESEADTKLTMLNTCTCEYCMGEWNKICFVSIKLAIIKSFIIIGF